MTKHLVRGLERLKEQVIALSELVESNLSLALTAFAQQDMSAARRVTDADQRVDDCEVEIEEECLKILALHQPVAMDLRFIVAVLRINSDLERIGDFAVNISWRVVEMEGRGCPPFVDDIQSMTTVAQQMLRESLSALIEIDPVKARRVLKTDDLVDRTYRELQKAVTSHIRAHPDHTELLLASLSIARALERVADHATNIAEDVIYMAEGEIIRHGRSGCN